jgi:UDP-glucose 4-epimerase
LKILVTGGAGFIGSNLTKGLLSKGHSVIGLDNLSQGYLLNIEEFKNHSGFEFMEGDVRNEKFVGAITQGCDVIIHLAAYKIPRYSDAIDTLLINAIGTKVILDAAAKNKISKVLVASTSDVYGKSPMVPFSEEDDMVIGRMPYQKCLRSNWFLRIMTGMASMRSPCVSLEGMDPTST